VAGTVAVGIGQFVASLGAQASSPIIAVGDAAIGLTPPPVKNFAISTFGSDDKTALLTGILILLALYAALIGILGARRLAYGLAGLAAFVGIGLAAAATRPGAGAGYLVPTVVAALASVITMVLLLRSIPGGGTATADDERGAGGGRPPGKQPPASRSRGDRSPGGSWVPDSGSSRAARPSRQPAPDGPATPEEQRRRFLVTSAVALGAAAVGGLAGRVLAERGAVTAARADLRIPKPKQPLPRLAADTDLRIPGLASFITPNSSFYRVDTALVLPQVPPGSWTLRIHGMVEREIEITFDELIRRPLIDAYVTLTCVSDPVSGPYIGNASWIGTSLASLIRQARPRAGADQILSTSTDGFTCGTPVQTVLDGRDALLAIAMNGVPLPVEHGFPARMVVPGLYGYVSATKWVTDINLTTFASQSAYWAQRGWSQQAPIKTESRIDVPTFGSTLAAGQTPVAGVAWAQHRGIDAVHVRVDRGPWNEAKLAGVPGIDTWRQWVWYWDATPGQHVIEARATDGTGYTQAALAEPPEPNGASGYPSVNVGVK
jgi:DMSO/TMAO reductase YedYZ molybdopterin-dependent catalytic subunit